MVTCAVPPRKRGSILEGRPRWVPPFFLSATLSGSGVAGSKQEADQVYGAAYAGARHGAVHADVLKVASDRELEPGRDGAGIARCSARSRLGPRSLKSWPSQRIAIPTPRTPAATCGPQVCSEASSQHAAACGFGRLPGNGGSQGPFQAAPMRRGRLQRRVLLGRPERVLRDC